MKIRGADFIAKILTDNGITNVFSVVGGGAMHLNDAFGHCEKLTVTYNHHEQAAAIAAEGYARAKGKPAAVCVTTGPGGTNAITGVLCAWQDNIPMIVISGQVRYDTTVEHSGLPLRQFGEQEHYIVESVKCMTKYAVMLRDPKMIRYEVEKALYFATEGRRGPCWVDVPLNIQGAMIEEDEQLPFIPPSENKTVFSVSRVVGALNASKRAVVLAGSAVRIPGVYEQFLSFIRATGLPVLAATSVGDILPVGDPQYYGNFGVFGGRPGNFIVQNADCILALGCRMTFKHVGFNYKQFAPEAKKIVVDVDSSELKKKLLKIDIPVCADLSIFFEKMAGSMPSIQLDADWIRYCDTVRKAFPIYQEKFSKGDKVNPYFFFECMKRSLPEKAIVVAGNSCACVSLLQSGVAKASQRLWGNVNCGTMGYDLPAAIGAAVASGGQVYCVTGDGSIQMNLQELQTIIGYKLPVKIIIFNNFGYHAIVQTQSNFFGRLSGCTEESGVTFPNFEKLAAAYGFPYLRCGSNEEAENTIEELASLEGCAICEVIENREQAIEPKQKSKMLPSGELVSPPICDLAPFLDEAVYKKYFDYQAMEWKGV